ncbi:sugar ABC transporter permease, partial [Salmonella enterica subsp. enterica serovar Newport]|nr:sugar ABC transporter permease [Salmonella enterica subsp. enterica serovar Newport]
MYARRLLWVWGFLALPVIFYAVIRFYPTLQAFWLSFTDWNLMNPAKFIGFDNYWKLWKDPEFWKVFKNTFAYLLIGTPISLVLSFIIAYYLDRVRFGQTFIRALYFLPFLTTATAMAWVWRWFYQPPPVGFINDVLIHLGLPAQPFLKSTSQALPTILV